MSDSNGYGFASMAKGRRLAALTAAAAAVALTALPDPAVAAELDPAYVDRVGGVDRGLRGADGPVRVRISADRQPLLRAALRERRSRLLHPPSRRFGSALGIAGREKHAARRAERSYEAGIRGLSRAARGSLRRTRVVTRTVRAHGGRVVDMSLVPESVVAWIDPSELGALGREEIVAAIDPAPAPSPLSGIGTSAVGAPAWWAAGFTGGTGAADTVPADAAIESEAADPDPPRVRRSDGGQRPDSVDHRSRHPHGRGHRLR